MSGQACITLDAVRCTVAGRDLLAIDRLHIAAGERVALVGHNGAGKTTLLRVLSGFMPVSEGRLTVLGHDLRTPLAAAEQRRLRAALGQVLQGLHLVARLSARENTLIGALSRIRGWRSWWRIFPTAEHARANAALQAVGMETRADTRADKLSGGERQKVAIARLLMQNPRIILADEPTAALDPAAAAEVCQLLAQAAANATLISVVHNPALLPLLADRVIGLKHGRIVFDLPIAHVTDAALTALYDQQGDAPCRHGHASTPAARALLEAAA